jgi:four helix bundle protein
MIDIELLNRNKNINRGYRKLEIWQEAIELYALVRNYMKNRNDIPFKTKAQIEDSIHSVSSNITEGYCRRSIKENIQFINVALASLGENYSQLFALVSSKDIEREWFNNYDRLHYSLENKMISFNKKLIQKFKNNDEWKNDYVLKELEEVYGDA